MIKKILFLLLAILASLTSCKMKKEPLSPKELLAKYENSVVRISNTYYYSIELAEGIKVYFTHLEKGKLMNLTFIEEKVKEKAQTISGTGFFISNEGDIATNNNVTGPSLDRSDVLNGLNNQLREEKLSVQDKVLQLNLDIAQLRDVLFASSKASGAEQQKLQSEIFSKENEKKRIIENTAGMTIDPITTKVVPVTLKMEVIYNGKNHQTEEAELIKFSEDNRIDLSIVQLKSKKTPAFIKNIFNFENNNPNADRALTLEKDQFDIYKPLSMNKKVFMIGFEGGAPKLLEGSVNYKSNKLRVICYFPSLPSDYLNGCPVIDEWGNLLAVNFNKIEAQQHFNYGIVSRNLYELFMTNPKN